jgi:protease-4
MHDEKTSGKILMALFILSILTGIVILAGGTIGIPKKELSIRIEKNRELVSTGIYPADTIAVLNIFSPISYNESQDYFGLVRSGAVYWIDLLKSVEDNPNVKAVIIRINSPGGTIGATQEIYNEVRRLREKGKIITVSMGDIAASGAYYISSAADYIMANPGSLVGSIGVIVEGLDLSELFRKFGISYNVIKSGKNKDILAPYRKMTDEEREILTELIMDAYSQFFQAVSNGRHISAENLQPIADGRIFTGRQALKYKLVDEIGDFEDTIKVTAKLAKIPGTPNVVELKSEINNIFKLLSSIGVIPLKNEKVSLFRTPIGDVDREFCPVYYLYSY